MDLGLTGARALIGGGSGGLGGAIAQALARRGRPDRADRPAGREARGGRRATRWHRGPGGPRRRRTARASAVEAAVAAFGGLDLLVVNSGGPPPGRFDELDEATWQAAIDGTLWSAIRLLRAALPHLRDGRDPAILVDPVELRPRADPGPHHLEPHPPRAGRPDQVAGRGDRPGPDQRARAGPARDGPDRPDRCRPAASSEHRLSRRSSSAPIERIPLGRYGDPLELGRVGAFLLSPAASYVTGAIVPGRWRDDPGRCPSGTRTRGS